MRRTFIPLLAGLVQCQPATPPSMQRQPVTPPSALTPGPPPEAKGSRAEPLTPGPAPEAKGPRPKPAPDPLPALYRGLSTKRHHAIVRVRTTRMCLRFKFEALGGADSSRDGVLWLSGASGGWKLEFELSGATLVMKRASTQRPPQGVEVAMCCDQLVLGGTPERPTLNGAPVFDGLEGCNQALGREPAVNEAPGSFVPGGAIHCIPSVAADLSHPERSHR